MLMDDIVDLLPNPHGRAVTTRPPGPIGKRRSSSFLPAVCLRPSCSRPFSDQYGKYSFVKVVSGTITPDMPMVNARTGGAEKLGRLYVMRGKKATEVKELSCGDIGAIAKMGRSRPAILSATPVRWWR